MEIIKNKNMTTEKIYKLAVDLGIKSDLRGKDKVLKYLNRQKKRYEKMSDEDKKLFDKEKLTNPYSDTRILNKSKKNIKKILAGIDIDGSELMLARDLKADLVISHHPIGSALADLHGVMDLQAEVLELYGLPINIAESITKLRISEVSRGVSPANHYRWSDMAKALNLDFMCTHTVADNLGARYLFDLISKKEKELEYVEDVLNLLNKIPEYNESKKMKAGPMLFNGSPESRCGKIVITEFTGGTSGSKNVYEKMSQYGIGTIIGMHMHEEHRKEAEKHHINVIIAGHMASDSLGMNLFLDELEKKGIEIVPISGLIRIKRF
jgi:putative NIF3 family GTP cyclohydrolase 1 type 2